MSNNQLVQPNPNTVGNVGYCLAFGESAFNTPHLHPNAFSAWQATQFKHPNEEPPTDVSVPIWFSYMIGSVNEGHIAINIPGRGILSSPYKIGTTQAWLPSIAELERIYSDNGIHPLTYLGWSEDIAGIRVVESINVPSISLCTYTPQIPTKQMLTSLQPTNWWNLNNDSTDINNFQPAAVLNIEVVFPVGGYAVNRHFPQYTYAMTPEDYARAISGDFSTNNGVNIADLHEVPVPIPPPPPPIAPPAAPVTVPPAERYTTITTLMTFPTSADAMSSTNGLTTLKSGTYYVWAKNGKAYQLSTDNMHEPTGNWINTLLNVPDKPKPPVVIPIPSKPVLLPSQVKPGTESDTAWRSSYKSFYHDRHSDLYEVKQHLTMLDYSGKRNPVAVQPGDQMNVAGTFLKDGVMFYRTRSGRDEYFTWFYGISLYDDYGNIQIVKVVETDPAKIERRLSDFVHYWKDDFKDIWDIIIRKKK